MAAGTGQQGQVNLERTTWTEEPGQNREDKSENDSNARTAVSGEPWTRLLGQDSWHRRAGIEQPGRNCQDRTARTGKPGQNSWDRTAREYRQDSTSGTGKEDKTNRKGQQGQGKGIEQL